MRPNAFARHTPLLRLFVCLSLLVQSLIPQVAAAAAPSARPAVNSAAPMTKAAARQEIEAAVLPDLEEVRRRPKHAPKAIQPIPSTRRRCPPRNPHCNESADGAPQATPTPTPPVRAPKEKPREKADAAPATSPAGMTSLASVIASPLRTLWMEGDGGGLPVFDFSLLDFYRGDGGYGYSDASTAGPLAGVGRGYGGAFPFVQGGPANLAQGKVATQSTTFTALSPNGDAWRAVDGNTDGGYFSGSVTHTNGDSQPWWQVDLGAILAIGNIDLWNRTDCCAERLANYYVFVSDVPFTSNDPAQTQAQSGVWTTYNSGQAPTHSTLAVNRTGRYVRVQLVGTGVLSLAEVQVFAGSGPVVVPPQGIPPAESVAWMNVVGVTPSGNSLTKPSGATTNWDTGAMSTKAIASGDGYVEFTASETNTYRMAGLSHGDSNQDYADIDFAIYPAADGTLHVYESGVHKGGFGAYATGDRLRVSVTGGVVSYSKNGVTIYTSAAAPRYPLLVDAALYHPGATLNNVVISGALVENIVWTNVAGVTASGNNLSKGGATGWNAGASSTRVIAGGDGYAEFTVDTNTHRMFGLSRGDSNQDYTDIDFAVYPTDGGGLYVYEAGVNKAYLGTYAAGDRVRVSVEGGQVRYRRNGALLYTSTVAPQYPLLVDTSLYSTGATLHNAVISAPLPSQTDPGGTGLTGRYYDNLDFTGYKLTRLDYTIDYGWDQAAPAPGVGPEEFSVRWTGMVVPRYSQTYTFYTTSDDGVRLWVDGQLIIDKWQDQGATEWTGQIALEAGRAYTIKMEFYDRFWGAVAKLSWSSTSQPKEIVPQSRLLPCWKSVEQFVTDLYQAALRRQPTSYELQDWTERLAQAQGEAQQIAVAQTLGRMLFDSTEYAGLNPSDNSRFVSDLYWGFLQRTPDAGGLSWWTGEVNTHGRGHGIVSFADSIEFKEKVARLCGTAATSGTNAGDGYNFAAARLDPVNRTGGGGADPYSRNYNFSIPLVSLAGRAGLDLGLTLSYNSLVWTKDGTGVTFDADRGTPSPGFRLGFPTLQPKFYNSQAQKYAYMLVTPAGARVELRQVGTSNLYESVDSSYLQLTEGGTPMLLASDGTQLSFTAVGGEWRCSVVKDRNGNYLTVAYYGDGRIQQVSDTLGRVVTFNYDNYQNLLSITQPWRRETETNPNPTQDETHQWATFGYTNVTLLPQFSNLAVIGEQPGTVIPALSQVGLADGSYYKFSYNQWGQVWKVTRYAADSVNANGQPNESHPLTSTRLNLPGSDLLAASPQEDCPRFTQERTWVENGVMNQSAEVSTSYDAWTPSMSSCEVTLPDGTKQVSFYGSASLWQKGLVTSSEVRSGGQVVKTTAVVWEHDGAVNASYPTNPRVKETTISDPQGSNPQANARTTRVTYTTPDDFKLNNGYTENLNLKVPRKVEECTAGCSTVLRTTVTDYSIPNLGMYVQRRILGLARNQYLYDGAEATANLRSRVEYVYDELNDDAQSKFLAALPSPASQHDGAGYGQEPQVNDQEPQASSQGRLRWRGNANRIRRYSVDPTTGAVGGYVESRVGFQVTGTVAFTKDASGHKTSVNYADSFYLNIRRTQPNTLQTYAYPTTITDPDGFRVTNAYNYDMGVVTEGRTPLPDQTADLLGPLSRSLYDAAGRLVRSSSDGNGSYTRMVYTAKMDMVESFTLVEAGKESRSVQVFDGAGRTRAVSRYLPPTADPGTGAYNYNYSGQKFDYDEMGRLVRQTNPAEVTASWALAGEDSAWVYTRQTFDWQGRPLVTTHEADGSTYEYQYGGCGCAGGQAVSTRDEVGRRWRVTYDVTGKIETTQIFTQQATNVGFTILPTESPYSTVTNTYDGLGRITEVKEREESSGKEQMTTTEYDGHGRLKRRRLPQYEANKFMTYAYNDDDTLASVTDPRDAVTAYDYEENKRHLVKKVTHTLSGSPTLTTTFQYDAAGNRKLMDDGPGWITYEYDTLSQLRKESRHFDSLSSNSRNPYVLNYTYTSSGKLKTITDPFDSEFSYGYDRAGQLREVKGSSYANVTTYAENVQYRAWGGVKSASFGNGASQTTTFDSRMRPWQYRLTGGSATPQREDFTYYADGRLQRITDLDDGTRQTSLRYHTMSRAYTYDHVGRVKEAGGHAPAESGGNGLSPNWPSPYLQFYGYDGFGNMTSRTGTYGYRMSLTDTSSYLNNRRQGWDYDAAGRVTHSTDLSGSGRTWTYDAAGILVTTAETAAGVTRTLTQTHDGDGQNVYSSNGSTAGTDYVVRSSVLDGEVVTRLTSTGTKGYTYVPARGLVRARQVGSNSSGQPAVEWSHPDPLGVSENGPAAYDPLGNFTVLPPPPPQSGPWPQPSGYYGPIWGGAGSIFSDINNYSTGCLLDGRPADCNLVNRQSEDGWSEPRGGSRFEDGQRTVHVVFDPGPVGSGSGGGPLYGQACVESEDAWGIHKTCETYVSSNDRLGGLGVNRPFNVGSIVRPTSAADQNPCEKTIAEMFGDAGGLITTDNDFGNNGYRGLDANLRSRAFDNVGLAGRVEGWGNAVYDSEHLYNFPHISGDAEGRSQANVYVPGNFVPGTATSPTAGDAVMTFFYAQLGAYKNVTLAVIHVDGGKVPANNPNGEKVLIGKSGGPGGRPAPSGPNKDTNGHVHFEIWLGKGYKPPGAARDAARLSVTRGLCPTYP